MKELFANELFLVDIRWIEIFACDFTFELTNFAEVEGHVCRKNRPNHQLPHSFKIRFVQSAENIVFFFTKDFKCGGDVVVFEDGDVVVADGLDIPLFNKINIVKTHMSNIMASSSNDVRHHVPFVQGAFLSEFAVGAEEVEGLSEVCAMCLIMISNVII